MRCVQSSWFGFYALRAAARSILLGINHLIASVNALDSKLNAPALFSAYSAAFQVLHGYLALEARVICDEQPSQSIPTPLRAVLARHGKWVIEGTQRTHTSRWIEIERTVRETGGQRELPTYFEPLFRQLCFERCQEGVTLDDLIRVPPNTRKIPMLQYISEFMRAIPQARHVAAYQSFGDDPWLVEGLINRDAFGGDLGRQAATFAMFATEFMEDVAYRTVEIMEEVSWSEVTSKLFVLSAMIPWFDEPQVDRAPSKIRQLLKYIWNRASPISLPS